MTWSYYSTNDNNDNENKNSNKQTKACIMKVAITKMMKEDDNKLAKWLCKIYPANIYLFNEKNRNARKRSEICSELTIKTPPE